jgi:hypothetical protein
VRDLIKVTYKQRNSVAGNIKQYITFGHLKISSRKGMGNGDDPLEQRCHHSADQDEAALLYRV